MKLEWYVVRYSRNGYYDKSPCGLTKSEAIGLAQLGNRIGSKSFEHKAEHIDNIPKT